jgi:hypothetical protein
MAISAIDQLCFYLSNTDGQTAAAEWERSYVTASVLGAAHERCMERPSHAPDSDQGMRALGRLEGIAEFRKEVLTIISQALHLNEQRERQKLTGLGVIGDGLGALVPTYGADEVLEEESAGLSDILSRPPFVSRGDNNVVAPTTVTEK